MTHRKFIPRLQQLQDQPTRFIVNAACWSSVSCFVCCSTSKRSIVPGSAGNTQQECDECVPDHTGAEEEEGAGCRSRPASRPRLFSPADAGEGKNSVIIWTRTPQPIDFCPVSVLISFSETSGAFTTNSQGHFLLFTVQKTIKSSLKRVLMRSLPAVITLE